MSAYYPPPPPTTGQYGQNPPGNSKSIKNMRAPYYMPPYYPIPPLTKGLPMGMVDAQLPLVRFKSRPRSLKIAIGMLILGVVFCIFGALLIMPGTGYNFLIQTAFIYFISLAVLGIISIIFLIIPKKIGWYLAFITGIAALPGFGIGTLIAIFLIIALLWPSIRYYFHTGQYPPNLPSTMTGPAPYGVQPYPMGHIPTSFKPYEDNERKE
jgi:hypothetical protein